MPMDQVLIPDMAQLYYAAVRALKYCELSSDHAESALGNRQDTCQPVFFRRRQSHARKPFSRWLHSLFRST